MAEGEILADVALHKEASRIKDKDGSYKVVQSSSSGECCLFDT